MKLYVKDTAKNQSVLVGVIMGDTLMKHVERRKHFMRVENGYGINKEGLAELVKRHVRFIRIHESDTENQYETEVKDWRDFGHTINYGHGTQVFLPMRYYKIWQEPILEYTENGLKKKYEIMREVLIKKGVIKP